MKEYMQSAREVLKELAVDPDAGLSESRVEENREKYGKNAFTREKPKSVLRRIGEALLEPMLIILLEKTSMIGMLKALGMRNRAIRTVFILRSFRIIATGMLWGNLIGLGLALLQQATGLVRLNSAGYILSHVPIAFDWSWWCALNLGIPVVMLLLMGIPAQAVAAVKPEKTIRYQ